MKTPSPHEAAKTWAREKGDKLAVTSCRNVVPCSHLAELIQTALLEADKNGYERGRKEDEALLRVAEDILDFVNDCGADNSDIRDQIRFLLAKLKQRLAPSGSVSEGKEKPND